MGTQSQMMGSLDLRHLWQWEDDFFGGGTFGAAASENDPWVVSDTSDMGTPTYGRVDLGEATVSGALGSVSIAFDATEEVQNVCLYFGDKLCFDADKVRTFETRVKMGQATADSATSFAIGLAGDRNATIDTMAIAAIFRVVGADSTTALVVETDDATNNNDDVATGTTLVNGWKVLKIEFPPGNADVKFFVDDVRVASGTTFDMSQHHGGLQPFVQLQKTSDTTTDSVQIDYIRVTGVR